jgi:acyl-coenzyme A thioesterase PaaI-like protein
MTAHDPRGPDVPPPSHHPALRGREAEARALADAVRRIVELTVANTAGPEQTASFAADLDALAERMAVTLPDAPVPRFIVPPDEESGESGGPPLGSHMPYDVVIGGYNPLALPVTLEFDPPRALGRARFTVPYEGAPGCVHGAVLAGVFDIVLTAANAVAGATGPTVRLALRYRRPTLLDQEVVFEAWVTEQTERRIHSLGRAVQGGEVTIEAEGEFAVFDHAMVGRMAASRRIGRAAGPTGAPSGDP